MTDKPEHVEIKWDGLEENQVDDDMCKASLAFDQWYSCLTVGKQLNNYYRYGEKRGCGKHWSKLRLCMGMKLRSTESRKALMEEHMRQEQSERESKPNVLDIWTRRTVRLENFPPLNPGHHEEGGY